MFIGTGTSAEQVCLPSKANDRLKKKRFGNERPMLNWILEKALSCAWKHSCHSSKLWIKSAANRQQMGGKCIKYDSFGPCQRMLCSRSICMENALVWSWMGRTKVQVQWCFFSGLKCHGNCGTFDDSPHPEHPGTYRPNLSSTFHFGLTDSWSLSCNHSMLQMFWEV